MRNGRRLASLVAITALLGAGAAQAQARRRAPGATRPPAGPVLKIWQSVAAGGSHTCALDNTGQAYCWGDNAQKRLGITDSVVQRRPVAVGTPQRFRAISAGDVETCALTQAGSAVCWGGPHPGVAPHSVTGDTRWRSLVVRFNSCGIDSSGQGFCWGTNTAGQLGTGNASTGAATPQLVGGAPRWLEIQPGVAHGCGLTAQHAARCWGRGTSGQLGDGRGRNSNSPVAVAGGMTFASLAVGGDHSCGVTQAGKAYCWGSGAEGQLGTGRTTNAVQPEAVAGGQAFSALAAGLNFTCGLTTRGRALCWGKGTLGALGNNAARGSSTPVEVAGNLVFRSISAGRDHACAVTNDSVIYCWGSNDIGQLGVVRLATCRDGAETVRCALAPARVQEPAR